MYCKQSITNTKKCDREEYRDGYCIIHYDNKNKPSNLFRKIIRDDIYRGMYNFSHIISYDGFSFEGLKIEDWVDINFTNSFFAGPFQIRNIDLKSSLDFTNSKFDSGFFITLSNIHKDIILKNSNISLDFNMSLSNFFNLDFDNIKIESDANFSNSEILSKLSFNHIHFKRNLSFLNVVFRDDSIFQNIVVEGDVDFRNVYFFKKLQFENVEFKGKTIPEDFIYNKKIDFKNVLINGELIKNSNSIKIDEDRKKKIKEARDKLYNDAIYKFNKK